MNEARHLGDLHGVREVHHGRDCIGIFTEPELSVAAGAGRASGRIRRVFGGAGATAGVRRVVDELALGPVGGRQLRTGRHRRTRIIHLRLRTARPPLADRLEFRIGDRTAPIVARRRRGLRRVAAAGGAAHLLPRGVSFALVFREAHRIKGALHLGQGLGFRDRARTGLNRPGRHIDVLGFQSGHELGFILRDEVRAELLDDFIDVGGLQAGCAGDVVPRRAPANHLERLLPALFEFRRVVGQHLGAAQLEIHLTLEDVAEGHAHLRQLLFDTLHALVVGGHQSVRFREEFAHATQFHGQIRHPLPGRIVAGVGGAVRLRGGELTLETRDHARLFRRGGRRVDFPLRLARGAENDRRQKLTGAGLGRFERVTTGTQAAGGLGAGLAIPVGEDLRLAKGRRVARRHRALRQLVNEEHRRLHLDGRQPAGRRVRRLFEQRAFHAVAIVREHRLGLLAPLLMRLAFLLEFPGFIHRVDERSPALDRGRVREIRTAHRATGAGLGFRLSPCGVVAQRIRRKIALKVRHKLTDCLGVGDVAGGGLNLPALTGALEQLALNFIQSFCHVGRVPLLAHKSGDVRKSHVRTGGTVIAHA